MNLSDLLFWNVDTQYDFISPEGKLYVQDAEKLKPLWVRIRKIAEEKQIQVVNTADWHNSESAEISASPDFIHTFPEHCIAFSKGAEFIEETAPEDPVIFDWDKEYLITPELLDKRKNRNIVIRKDVFNVFKGNRWTQTILKLLKPKNVVVYGVTTNVCVDQAVTGLIGHVEGVYVIRDAIKELPGLPLPFDTWKEKGVKLIQLDELKEMLD